MIQKTGRYARGDRYRDRRDEIGESGDREICEERQVQGYSRRDEIGEERDREICDGRQVQGEKRRDR